MLTATNLSKRFGGVHAVENVSFEILEGQITALIGPNGAGKTTLFNLLSGTVSVDEGNISLRGKDITHAPVETCARLGLSRTFQLARPFRNLTVFDHLALASTSDDDRLWSGWIRARARQADFKGYTTVLKRVGLEVSLQTSAADLSYGQSKLLAIAMALIHPHIMLLLDEPVAGVNPVLRERIAELLHELRQDGETVLLIEHDMGFVMPLADHMIVMDRGKIIAKGTPKEMQKDAAVLQAYLGEQL